MPKELPTKPSPKGASPYKAKNDSIPEAKSKPKSKPKNPLQKFIKSWTKPGPFYTTYRDDESSSISLYTADAKLIFHSNKKTLFISAYYDTKTKEITAWYGHVGQDMRSLQSFFEGYEPDPSDPFDAFESLEDLIAHANEFGSFKHVLLEVDPKKKKYAKLLMENFKDKIGVFDYTKYLKTEWVPGVGCVVRAEFMNDF